MDVHVHVHVCTCRTCEFWNARNAYVMCKHLLHQIVTSLRTSGKDHLSSDNDIPERCMIVVAWLLSNHSCIYISTSVVYDSLLTPMHDILSMTKCKL